MKAICLDCGNLVDWRNQRGVRLADHRCPRCNGKLRVAVYDETKKVYVQRQVRSRGKVTKVSCYICGHKRLAGGSMCYQVKQDTVFKVTNGLHGQTLDLVVPADAWLCRHHWPTFELAPHLLTDKRLKELGGTA